jgi:TolB protein
VGAGAAALALLRDGDSVPAGQSDVFSVDVESGEVRNRTESKASEYLLSLSPDGHRVAFVSFGLQPDQEIFVADVETAAARPLSRRRGSDDNPVFSPDGARLAWVNVNFIHVARANGTDARRVTRKPQIIVDPLSWSANGRIYFTVWPRRIG